MNGQILESDFIGSICGDHDMEGDRATVLVVDDENGPRQALRMLLKEEFNVVTAESVRTALGIMDAQPIDVVITDLRMPEQTGIELLKAVREQYPSSKVIILTGYGQLDTALRAIDYGAFAYIEKPFDNEEMLSRVRACLNKRREETEHLALEELAFQANRFETLGRLITGTMHDLATPLSVIATHLEMLSDNPGRTDMDTRLRTMRAQISHCTDIVRTTMNYLRQTPGKRAPFSLNIVAMASLEVARPILVKEGILTELETDPELPMLTGELVLVRQAILNLITNACQALQQAGGAGRIRLQTWREEGWACLAIEDNGPGIPKAHRPHVFEALFTTKAERGTGLGLAVVRHVMEHHGGEVMLKDGEGGGARFVLRFPST